MNLTLVFLLEEPSAKEFLKGLLPRILPPEITVKFLVFEGKSDLDRNVERKLRHWRQGQTHFIILRDQDSTDCHSVKESLSEKVRRSGKPALVRIACRELESWYLGDLEAVSRAFDLPTLSALQNKRKFREPDRLGNPSNELRRLTQDGYQKVSGSRLLGPCVNLEKNRSRSFNVFISGVCRLAQSAEQNRDSTPFRERGE